MKYYAAQAKDREIDAKKSVWIERYAKIHLTEILTERCMLLDSKLLREFSDINDSSILREVLLLPMAAQITFTSFNNG